MVEHPVPQRLQAVEGALQLLGITAIAPVKEPPPPLIELALAHLGASACWPPQKDGRLNLIVAVGPTKHNEGRSS